MAGRKPDVEDAAIEGVVRRAFGAGASFAFRRTASGVSTQVYRVERGAQTFYLRVAEEVGENLETDAELHQRLRALGVKVPEVVYVMPFDARIGRSVMITTEVPGVSLAESGSSVAAAAAVVEAAGADLALLSQVAVDGYGWVVRGGRQWPMRAEHADYPSFVTSCLPRPWPGRLAELFSRSTLGVVESVVEHERARPLAGAVLAHGDFDTTPIFCVGASYTGLIDFGEIRGAEPTFDLGHFALHEREEFPFDLLPALLRGYERVRPLPPDRGRSIHHSAILLGLRQLCRWLGPGRDHPLHHTGVRGRVRRLTELIRQPVRDPGC